MKLVELTVKIAIKIVDYDIINFNHYYVSIYYVVIDHKKDGVYNLSTIDRVGFILTKLRAVVDNYGVIDTQRKNYYFMDFPVDDVSDCYYVCIFIFLQDDENYFQLMV